VKINCENVFVCIARVSAMVVNEWWPGHQRPIEQTEKASFVYFDFKGKIKIEFNYLHNLWNVKRKLERLNILPKVVSPRFGYDRCILVS